MSKNYDKEQLLADWKTGAFTQRQLAHKYNLSNGRIAALTKNIRKDLEEIVSSQVHAGYALSLKTEKEVSAVNEQVSIKTKHLLFIHNATLKNASVMMKKINKESLIIDHKMAQETLNKAGEALGVLEKGGTVINNTNAQQNNPPELIVNIGSEFTPIE